VNSLLCSKKARILSGELFGDDILFIKYTDPGYTLFKKVSDELVRFRKLKGFDPKIILLEIVNHITFLLMIKKNPKLWKI